RKLVVAVAGALALVATGYLVPTLIYGGPGLDRTATGSTETVARAGMAATLPPRLEVAAIPAPPPNLLMLDVPEASPAPAAVREAGSTAFRGALEMLVAGEHERAFELANAIADSAE